VVPLPERYAFERLAGRGGMATVYRARDQRLKRTVAVKVLRSDESGSEVSLGRFRREAEVLASLRHPNIVEVYDIERLPSGEPYLVMEWMEGGSLQDRFSSQGTLPEGELRRVAHQVGSALAAAHRAGVIHRDVKPHNILCDASGVPHLADFGVARHIDDTVHTRTGQVVGTPQYMAPEQLQGKPSEASDVYALALSLVFLATGHRDPAALKGTVSRGFARLLRDATSLRASDRIPHAEHFVDRLEALTAREARRWSRPLPWLLIFAGLSSALLLWSWTQGGLSRPQLSPPPAEAPTRVDPEADERPGVPPDAEPEAPRSPAAPTSPTDPLGAAPGKDGRPAIAASDLALGPPKEDDDAGVGRTATRSIPSPVRSAAGPSPPRSDPGDPEEVAAADAEAAQAAASTATPVCHHSSPRSVALDRAVTLSARLEGAPMATAHLHHRQGGDWRRRAMEVRGDTARVQLTPTNPAPLEYWIELRDPGGATHQAGSRQAPLTLQVR
jgi:serine/threonine-protein kinase